MKKISRTKSFLLKALRVKHDKLVTRDNFDAHELLEWAMFFAAEAGYEEGIQWYEEKVYPVCNNSYQEGTLVPANPYRSGAKITKNAYRPL